MQYDVSLDDMRSWGRTRNTLTARRVFSKRSCCGDRVSQEYGGWSKWSGIGGCCIERRV